MKAKTYYIHANTLSGLKRRVNPARRGEPHLVIKASDIEKLVEKAARALYSNSPEIVAARICRTSVSRWSWLHEHAKETWRHEARALFKFIGLL